jgi:hypothetical protein
MQDHPIIFRRSSRCRRRDRIRLRCPRVLADRTAHRHLNHRACSEPCCSQPFVAYAKKPAHCTARRACGIVAMKLPGLRHCERIPKVAGTANNWAPVASASMTFRICCMASTNSGIRMIARPAPVTPQQSLMHCPTCPQRTHQASRLPLRPQQSLATA